MLTLYGDNGYQLQTPPVTSVSYNDSFQISATYNFNACSQEIWNRLVNFVRMRNNTGIKSEGVNINGKAIGDYTCLVLDQMTGRKFYAKIDINTEMSKETMFFDPQGWNSTGRTFSMTVTEVEV